MDNKEMRVALKIAYDGRYFNGYARQPQQKTIENQLIEKFIEVDFFADPKTAMFQSASRTDKGVSCLGNVIAFNTNKDVKPLLNTCNSTQDHIIIYGFKPVTKSFYPRYAKQRKYRYYLEKTNETIEAIRKTISLFIGKHDFTNFARIEPKKNPMRTIDDIVVQEKDNYFMIDITAQTFLWHQIRRIISSITQVERKKITRNDITVTLKHPEQPCDFGIASSQFLILTDVLYDFTFEIDTKGKKKS